MRAASFLGRYGVSGAVQTQVMGQLSDGQKSRVVLAKIAKENPHLLFLDEPTNHLDMESIDSLAKAINKFEGGMVLVSHDMRLISQVAKEIWMVDNKTVRKFVGEINDFKMHLRKQMMKSNLIEGGAADKEHVHKKVEDMFVPLAPMKTYGDAAPKLQVAPPAPPVPPTTEEEAIRKARLELADMAIKKQRERQAAEKAAKSASGTDAAGNDLADDNSGNDDDERDAEAKKAAKEAKKAQRKAEKEAAKAWEIEQAAILEKRKAEKEADIKAAMEEAKEEEGGVRGVASGEELNAMRRKPPLNKRRRREYRSSLDERRAERDARRAAREKRRAEEEAT